MLWRRPAGPRGGWVGGAKICHVGPCRPLLLPSDIRVGAGGLHVPQVCPWACHNTLRCPPKACGGLIWRHLQPGGGWGVVANFGVLAVPRALVLPPGVGVCALPWHGPQVCPWACHDTLGCPTWAVHMLGRRPEQPNRGCVCGQHGLLGCATCAVVATRH